LRAIYRSASLSNENDRQALLENPHYLELPASALNEGHTRVAESAGGEIVGFATLEPGAEVAELVDLFVDPAAMRTGVGRALIEDAMHIIGAKGIRTLEVTANPHALPFYEATGFRMIGSTTTALGPGWRMRLTRS
jgi:GNAT superfamily N-acetyltransferase